MNLHFALSAEVFLRVRQGDLRGEGALHIFRSAVLRDMGHVNAVGGRADFARRLPQDVRGEIPDGLLHVLLHLHRQGSQAGLLRDGLLAGGVVFQHQQERREVILVEDLPFDKLLVDGDLSPVGDKGLQGSVAVIHGYLRILGEVLPEDVAGPVMRGVGIIQLVQLLERLRLPAVHQPAEHHEKFGQVNLREAVLVKGDVFRLCPVLIRQVGEIQRYDHLFPVIAAGLNPLQLPLVFEPRGKVHPVQNAVFHQRRSRDAVGLAHRLQIGHNLRGQNLRIFLGTRRGNYPHRQQQGEQQRKKPFSCPCPSTGLHVSSLLPLFLR